MVLNKRPLENPGKAPIREPNTNDGPSSPLSDPAPLPPSTTETDPELNLFQTLVVRTEKHNALVQKMNLFRRASGGMRIKIETNEEGKDFFAVSPVCQERRRAPAALHHDHPRINP